jgi:hypothetical protein
MAKLTTSAWILHDLGMAAGFGGTLFGKAALDPAVKHIGSMEERGRVLDKAWGRFRVLDAVGLGAVVATWLAGRSAFSGRRLGREVRSWVVVKDVLVGGALATGVATLIAGAVMHRQARRRGGARGSSVPQEGAPAVRFLAIVGPLHAMLVGGAIAANAALAQAAGKSARWSGVSRLLP